MDGSGRTNQSDWYNAMSYWWWRPVEQIMLAAIDSKSRVLGIFGPQPDAGVSTLCEMVAESFARSGTKTLLVDLSRSVTDPDPETMTWVPGATTAQVIVLDPRGYDVVAVPPTIETRPLFNNIDTLRRMFADELADYQAIIVDLPAVLDRAEDMINTVAVARACDSTIMVCVTGRTTSQEIKMAMDILGTAGVQLGGTVLNDTQHPPLWR